MAALNIDNAQLYRVLANRFMGAVGNITLSGAYTLTDDHPMLLIMDANGAARNVTLPATSRANAGQIFLIYNSAAAANSLTIKQSDGSTTVATVAQGKLGIFFNKGDGVAASSWVGGATA